MEVNVLKYYKVKYYQLVMMRKRGYILSEYERLILDSSPEESLHYFLKFYLERARASKVVLESILNATYGHSKYPKNTVRVLYIETSPDEAHIKKDKSDQVLSTIQNDPVNSHFILISAVKFTPASFKDLSELSTGIIATSDNEITRYWLEFFLHDELLLDPTVHELLQPTFELLSVAESKAFLSRIKQDASRLMTHRIDDPAVKFLGGRVGQIVRLVRKLPYIAQVEENLVHRIIVNESVKVEPKKRT